MCQSSSHMCRSDGSDACYEVSDGVRCCLWVYLTIWVSACSQAVSTCVLGVLPL